MRKLNCLFLYKGKRISMSLCVCVCSEVSRLLLFIYSEASYMSREGYYFEEWDKHPPKNPSPPHSYIFKA